LESGQVRLLAVLGPERLPQFPQYPTAREQGLAYDAVGWRGLMLPKGAPEVVVDRLTSTVLEIGRSEEFIAFMRKNGFAVELRGPKDFAAFLEAEEAKWREVIAGAGYEALGRNHDPGPRAFPVALAILLLIAVGTEALRGSRSMAAPAAATSEKEATVRLSSGNAVFLIAALLVYVFFLPKLGFALTTVLFGSVVMWKLGTRLWVSVVTSLLLVLVIHLLLVTLFKVQLP
jgi:hypothetical protein